MGDTESVHGLCSFDGMVLGLPRCRVAAAFVLMDAHAHRLVVAVHLGLRWPLLMAVGRYPALAGQPWPRAVFTGVFATRSLLSVLSWADCSPVVGVGRQKSEETAEGVRGREIQRVAMDFALFMAWFLVSDVVGLLLLLT